ncbi:MAG: hypothetical protein WD851_01900 [Pirellulales bacterium]
MRHAFAYGIGLALLLVGVTTAKSEPEAVTIPLDQIWGYDMPGTQKVGEADAVSGDGHAAASLDEMYDRLVSRRDQQIGRVHSYSAAGKFPRNVDFPGQLVPYFVDREGTACAVGRLMQLDGCGKLVAQIATSSNHIRIEDISQGPLVDWIQSSGLTQEECALIQPGYATIEDYRPARPWQDETERLRQHFTQVEHSLQTQSQQSLGEALLAKVEAELDRDPSGRAYSEGALAEALHSDEPHVRIAATYAIGRLTPSEVSAFPQYGNPPPRKTVKEGNSGRALSLGMWISALGSNLADRDPAVRFWTAVALEKIGSASVRGSVELHRKSLPVFLETFRGNQEHLRLPAVIQLANTAPECINTSRQLEILPEIREALVEACRDEDIEIREFAQEVLLTWRWQRTAYESQRMRRHYLAESYELESLAAEASAMDREFAFQTPGVQKLLQHRSLHDVRESITYMLPVGGTTDMPIAGSAEEAAQLVDRYLRTIHADSLKEDNTPFWRIESVEPDVSDLYFAVTVWRTGDSGPKMVYVIPRPSMLSEASVAPHSWFKTVHQSEQYVWPASAPSVIRPQPDVRVVLGDAARDEIESFTETCDVFAYFMTHHSRVVIDRKVQESAETLTWSGRFAGIRSHKTRFFELGGGGSSTVGGGGWDFHRLTFSCDRTTGVLTLSAEPIAFAVTPVATETLSPAWVTEELKLMGWKPLESVEFFGGKLLPPEYSDAVNRFQPDNENEARQLLYRRWHMEKSLPQPYLVMGLLYDRANRREEALKCMERAIADGAKEPGTLADVARWEHKIGLQGTARNHAEAALKLWPDHSVAKDVLKNLDEAAAVAN